MVRSLCVTRRPRGFPGVSKPLMSLRSTSSVSGSEDVGRVSAPRRGSGLGAKGRAALDGERSEEMVLDPHPSSAH